MDCHVSYVNLEIARETVIWPNMTLTFGILTILLTKSEEQLESLTDIALFLFWKVIQLGHIAFSKLAFALKIDFDLNTKMY